MMETLWIACVQQHLDRICKFAQNTMLVNFRDSVR